MTYSLQSIDLFVREMPEDRMPFVVGQAISAKKRRPRAVWLVRLRLTDQAGNEVVGRSGDRPSFGWLDKRKDRTPDQKLSALADIVKHARELYLENGKRFESPFELWQRCHSKVMRYGQRTDHESLSASYASALFERAVIDAVCRLHKRSFFEMVRDERLGMVPGAVHTELHGASLAKLLPKKPRSQFYIRHTVGLTDPITADDLSRRINDGEPETLEEYVVRHGLRYFKVKISGNPSEDLDRLSRIWNVVARHADRPKLTLDGNEAFTDLEAFYDFVLHFEDHLPAAFAQTLLIEQPLTRRLTLDPSTSEVTAKIARRKPLAIDEADGTVDAYKRAFAIGYDGTSHKNCKGVFKSLLNRMLAEQFRKQIGRQTFLSGEDLANMPIVPLHQDFDALGTLDISHCERNGHHYSYGMSHLTPAETQAIAARHRDLYEQRDDEWFLKIRGGAVECASVFSEGFGGNTMPQWDALKPFDQWDYD
jgi:hypothetical protein